MIKVLVISNYHHLDSTRAEAEIFIALSKMGVSIEVMTFPDSPWIPIFKEQGIAVFPHHPDRKFDKASIALIRNRLVEGGFDILHLFNGKAMVNGIRAARGLPVKIITYRGAQGPYWHDPMAFFTHYHPRVSAIVCLSNYVKKSILKQRVVSEEKLHVIYKTIKVSWLNSVEPIKYDFLKDGELVLCCVANVRPEKGVEYLLKAMALLPKNLPIKLVLVGRNTDSKSIKKLMAKLTLDEKVIAMGYTSNALSHIAACDVYVQPSVSEGLSKTIMEAMALKKPILSTYSGGPEELIEHQKTGWLVASKNPKALAEAIVALYQNKKLRIELGQAAFEFIDNKDRFEQAVQKTHQLYQSLLSKV